jgi:hypothetical protein
LRDDLTRIATAADEQGFAKLSVEKTAIGPLDPGPAGERVDELLASMRRLARLGVTHYHGSVPGVASLHPLGVLGERVIPVAASF